MKHGDRHSITLTQPGMLFHGQTRFEQAEPGTLYFDVTLTGEAAKGLHTPFYVQICTPETKLPRTFWYEVSVWQSQFEVFKGEVTSSGSRASGKWNCFVDSGRPVTIKVECMSSTQVKGVWNPLLWVYAKARHVQNAKLVTRS